MNHIFLYLIIILIGATGGLGDIWIYIWAKTGKPFWLIVSCFVWVASLLIFGYLLKQNQRSLTNLFLLSTVMHVILVAAWDFIFAGNHFSKMEWIGVVFSVLAILFLELGKQELLIK